MDFSFEEVHSRQHIEACRGAEKAAEASQVTSRVCAGASEVRLHVLGSGSRGNAALVEDVATGEGVLIDCGICKRDFFTRSAEAGFDPAKLKAILITHDHTDHTKGLGVVLRGLAKQGIEPCVFAQREVRTASKEIRAIEDVGDIRELRAGDALSLAGMGVHVFGTSHDAAASCGFRFEGSNGSAVGFMTDTGIVTGEAHAALSGVRILALESNHDVRMLSDGPYPYPIKRRVASDVGHLSNIQAAAELELLLCSELEQIIAMHISQNNNTYRLPADSFLEVVHQSDHPARVQVAYQNMLVSVR